LSDKQTFEIVSDNGAAMRLEFDAERACLNVHLGSPAHGSHELELNAIGEGDPMDFLSGLEWHYVKSKIFSIGGLEPDFLETISSLRGIAQNFEEYDLTRAQSYELLDGVKDAMRGYDGNDAASCAGMVPMLQRVGFHDDTHHMICHAEPVAVRNFRVNVWDPLCEKIEDYMSYNTSPFDLEVAEDDFEMC